MAEFVRATIFGTTFEITSRYVNGCALLLGTNARPPNVYALLVS